MNAELLLDNLVAIAAGPGGVDRLRELILQLAVQGKLRTQDSSDEPASVLLDKINAEKKLLIKQGRIRQEQPLELVEIRAFQNRIPDNWRFTKLGEYCLIIMGQSPESRHYNEHESGLPFYQGKSDFGKIFPKPRVWSENPLKIAKKNDILISVRAPVGPTNICPSESCIGRGLTALRSLAGSSQFFLLYSLRASEKIIAEMGVGSTFTAISKKDLDNFVIAVPPLAEQYRIVEKVDRLMALFDDLESRQKAEREDRRRLRTASLAALEEAATAEEAERAWAHVTGEFGRLVDTVEDVNELRNATLQFAATGRLGNEIGTANQKCDIASWKEVRVDEILSEPMMNGHSVPSAEKGFPVLRLSAVRNGWVNLRERKIGKWTEKDAEPYLVSEGDFLVVRGNGSRQLVGRGGLVAEAPDRIAFPDTLIRLRFDKTKVLPEWISLIWRSAAIRSQTEEKAHTTSGIYKVSQKDIGEIRLLLPLLAEQHHVVERVNRLMTYCDGLEAGIRARDAALDAFAAAACRAVLGGPAPVAAPAAEAVKETGQQRLPV